METMQILLRWGPAGVGLKTPAHDRIADRPCRHWNARWARMEPNRALSDPG